MFKKTWLIIGMLIAGAVYLASGIFIVQPDELAVVRWFGHVPAGASEVRPGIHYALPWPMCRVDKPKVKEVRRVLVGLAPEQRQAIARGDLRVIEAGLANDSLTGDVNILKVTMVVQYQVAEKETVLFLFGTEDPDQLVRNTVQAVLIEVLAGLPVDRALTGGKAKLQQLTQKRSQAILNRYGCGVRLLSTDLESIESPRAIIAAFQEVVSAKKDGERTVDLAVAEAHRIVPLARGEAASVLESARAYQEERNSRARGQASRFLSVLAEYRKEPIVFKKRLLLQTLETVLPKVRIYVLDQQSTDPPTTVKIVETPGTR